MKIKLLLFSVLMSFPFFGCQTKTTQERQMLKALIIDGSNSHGVWPKITFMMKDYLEQTKMFEVYVARTHFTWQGPHSDKMEGIDDFKELLAKYPLQNTSTISVDSSVHDPNFKPDFKKYDLVVSNFGWKTADLPDVTKAALEDYVFNGGGFAVIHSANNAWGNWKAFNRMTGLGGWGGRDSTSGPYLFYNDSNEVQRDYSKGTCGSHGSKFNYIVKTRKPEHPIMKGIPKEWLHYKDELYDRLRGPAEKTTILATAFSDPEENSPPWDKTTKGTGRHEPILMAIEYGKGKVFHSTMGHMDFSMECVGFITTFQRGAEWAATGRVTQKLPEDFPTQKETSTRTWGK